MRRYLKMKNRLWVSLRSPIQTPLIVIWYDVYKDGKLVYAKVLFNSGWWRKYLPYRPRTTKLRFGFKGKNQLPLFMVWREYYQHGELIHAKVLFNSSRHTPFGGQTKWKLIQSKTLTQH